MRGVLGVLWGYTVLPTHFECRILFKDGLYSAPSRLLEPHAFQDIRASMYFEAPGFPGVLVVGEAAMEYLDCLYPGRAKESAVLDAFGRPCVEVTAPNAGAIDGIQGVRFLAPAFLEPTTTGDLREVLDKRRTS